MLNIYIGQENCT